MTLLYHLFLPRNIYTTIRFGILFILKSISFSFTFILTFICIASSILIALHKMPLKKIYIITHALNKRRKPAVTGYNKIHLNHPEGLESRQSSALAHVAPIQSNDRVGSIAKMNRKWIEIPRIKIGAENHVTLESWRTIFQLSSPTKSHPNISLKSCNLINDSKAITLSFF